MCTQQLGSSRNTTENNNSLILNCQHIRYASEMRHPSQLESLSAQYILNDNRSFFPLPQSCRVCVKEGRKTCTIKSNPIFNLQQKTYQMLESEHGEYVDLTILNLVAAKIVRKTHGKVISLWGCWLNVLPFSPGFYSFMVILSAPKLVFVETKGIVIL